MRKKVIITFICAVAAFVLFFPFVRLSYDDGGTTSYTALTYQIVRWHRFYSEDNQSTGEQTIQIKESTDFYLFPFNFRDNINNKVWSEEKQKYIYDFSPDNPIYNSEIMRSAGTDENGAEYICDAVLKFAIEPEHITISANDAIGTSGFYINVISEFVAGRLIYQGSSTVTGADIVVFDKDGRLLTEDPLAYTCDVTRVERKEGDTVSCSHHIIAGWNENDKFTPGVYSVLVSWCGQQTVFEDAVIITE